MTAGEEKARTAWRDAAARELAVTPIADNGARLLFALRGLVLLASQSHGFGVFERDAAMVEARAAILAAQGGRVLE